METRIVVLDDFLESLETPIMHIRCSEGDIAKRGRDEEISVSLPACDQFESKVDFVRYAVVVKTMIGEESAAMAVKAIGPLKSAARIILGHEQLKSPFFCFAEFALSSCGLIEARVV